MVEKVRAPDILDDVQHLAPGYMDTPKQPKSKKRKATVELSIEERLTNTHIENRTRRGLNTNTMISRLTQGLRSNSKEILDSVIDCNVQENILRNTVTQLHLDDIMPFYQYVYSKMSQRLDKNVNAVRWMKALLEIHSSHFSSCSNSVEVLGPLKQLYECHYNNFRGVCSLLGRLDVVKSLFESKTDDSSSFQGQPLLAYQDVSSDEELEAELFPRHSESEDPWDEAFSGMEDESQHMEVSGDESDTPSSAPAGPSLVNSIDSTTHTKKKKKKKRKSSR